MIDAQSGLMGQSRLLLPRVCHSRDRKGVTPAITPCLPVRYGSLLVETAEVVVLPAIALQSVKVLLSRTWETREIHIVSQVV